MSTPRSRGIAHHIYAAYLGALFAMLGAPTVLGDPSDAPSTSSAVPKRSTPQAVNDKIRTVRVLYKCNGCKGNGFVIDQVKDGYKDSDVNGVQNQKYVGKRKNCKSCTEHRCYGDPDKIVSRLSDLTAAWCQLDRTLPKCEGPIREAQETYEKVAQLNPNVFPSFLNAPTLRCIASHSCKVGAPLNLIGKVRSVSSNGDVTLDVEDVLGVQLKQPLASTVRVDDLAIVGGVLEQVTVGDGADRLVLIDGFAFSVPHE